MLHDITRPKTKSFDLNQAVNFPAHIHGHSLDLVNFSYGCDVLSVSTSDVISDYFSVIADLKIPTDHSHTVPQTTTYRQLKAIHIEASKADIKNSHLSRYPEFNATVLSEQYDSVLSTLIDPHAPLVTNKTSLKPSNPWMTPAILACKRHGRYLGCVRRRYLTALYRSILLSRYTSASDRYQRQNQLTIPKLLLTLAIIGLYGKHPVA